MRFRASLAVAGVMLAALAASVPASATIARGGALNSHATAGLDDQHLSDSEPDSWTNTPHDLLVVGGRTAANGDDFSSVQDAISAHWDSAHAGSVTLLDHGWITDATHGQATSVSTDLSSPTDAPAWTYAFTATGNGSFNLGFDLTGTGQTGGLGIWDVLFREDTGPDHLTFLTRTFPQGDFHLVNDNAFSHALLAGHRYQVSLITEEGLFDSLLNPARREASETGGFSWSISGGGRSDALPGEGAGVPEPATWALMIFGLGGVGAALRRRLERLAG